MQSNVQLTEAVPQFLLYLVEDRDQSQSTFRNYEHHMRYFLDWFGGEKRTADITVDVIKEYRRHLDHQKSKTRPDRFIQKSTREEKIKVIKRFLKYCNIQGWKAIRSENIELFKSDSDQKLAMTEEELRLILAAPEPEKSLLELRDKAIMEFLFFTGCRRGELPAIKKNQVDWVNKQLTIRGKGGKVRIIFLTDRAVQWLQRYIETREDQSEYLFTHSRKYNDLSTDRIGSRAILDLVKKYAKRAGLGDWIDAHTFRHTFAVYLLLNGVDIKTVQELLGHSSLRSTEKYLNIVNERLKKSHQQVMGNF